MRAISKKPELCVQMCQNETFINFHILYKFGKKSACHVAIYVQYVKMNLLSKKISTQHMCAK